MVVCRCGFKTFTPLPPPDERAESNVLPVDLAAGELAGAARHSAVARVGEFTWPSVEEFGWPPGAAQALPPVQRGPQRRLADHLDELGRRLVHPALVALRAGLAGFTAAPMLALDHGRSR